MKKLLKLLIGSATVTASPAMAQEIAHAQQSDWPYDTYRVAVSDAGEAIEKLSTADAIAISVGEDSEFENTAITAYLETVEYEATYDPAEQIEQSTNYDGSALEIIRAFRRQEDESRESYASDMNIDIGRSDIVPSDYLNGNWPDQTDAPRSTLSYGPLVHEDGTFVSVSVIPTNRPYEVPAYIAFGNWNSNPPAFIHVAFLRDLAERYGARPVTITNDVIELTVERRPETREEAMQLAEAFYLYCPDLLDQSSVGPSLQQLAHSLMTTDIWGFWWD